MSDLFECGSQIFLCILPLYGNECFIFGDIQPTECSFKVWYDCKVKFQNKGNFQANKYPEKPLIAATGLLSEAALHFSFPLLSGRKFLTKCSGRPFGS